MIAGGSIDRAQSHGGWVYLVYVVAAAVLVAAFLADDRLWWLPVLWANGVRRHPYIPK